MANKQSLREISKINYSTTGHHITDMQVGCMQRIADAVELMATEYVKLQNELAYFKGLAKDRLKTIENLESQVKSLKSVKTRYKNQLEALKAQKSFISSPEFETTA